MSEIVHRGVPACLNQSWHRWRDPGRNYNFKNATGSFWMVSWWIYV